MMRVKGGNWMCEERACEPGVRNDVREMSCGVRNARVMSCGVRNDVREMSC